MGVFVRLTYGMGPAVALVVVLAGCGGGGGGAGSLPVSPPGSGGNGTLTVSAPVSAANGGSAVLPDGSSVVVPPGFVSADGTVTLSEAPQGTAAPIAGWSAASGDLTVSFSSAIVTSQRRQSGARTAQSTGNLILNQGFPAANRSGVAASSALVIAFHKLDGSTAYLSPDITLDPSKNFVTTSLSPSVFAKTTAMTSTIQFAQVSALHNPYTEVFDPATNRWRDDLTPVAGKRTLILVHGIFSSASSTFPCAETIRSLGEYQQVIGFTYDWSAPLGIARQQFSDFVNALPDETWIDIEAHSYGSDVALESLPFIHKPIGNAILIAGPLPLNGMPLAGSPGFVRSFFLHLAYLKLWNPANTDPGSIDRAGRLGMLSSLATNSNEMKALRDLGRSLTHPPRFIEVAGTKPWLIEQAYIDAYFPFFPFPPNGPWDGVIEQRSALSTDFIGSGPQPLQMAFPYNHQDIVCNSNNNEVPAFVASSLLMPVVAAPTSLSFTQIGAAYAQTFKVSQKNHIGQFTLSTTTTNGAVATARIAGDTITVTPVGQGSTSVTVVGDGGISVTVPVSVSVAPGPLTASVSSLSFSHIGSSYSQQFTVSQPNYGGAFAISAGPDTRIATAQIVGATITVTPVGQGSTQVTVSGGGGQSVTVGITVTPATAQTLATGLYGPSYLVLQSGFIYIADFGSVDRIPVSGGTLEQLVTGQTAMDSGQSRGIDRISFAGTDVYYGFGGYVNYSIDRLTNGAGPPAQVATVSGGDFIGTMGSNLYYSSGFCCIQAQLLSGGSAHTVQSNVWVRSLATDASAIYFVDYNTKNVDRFDISAGTLTSLITGNAVEGNITVNRQNVYFSDGTMIAAVAKNGGSVTRLYSGQHVQLLTADDLHVFFLENAALKSVPVGGGTPQTLVANVSIAAAVSDGTYLYYADSPASPGAATLYRLAL